MDRHRWHPTPSNLMSVKRLDSLSVAKGSHWAASRNLKNPFYIKYFKSTVNGQGGGLAGINVVAKPGFDTCHVPGGRRESQFLKVNSLGFLKYVVCNPSPQE